MFLIYRLRIQKTAYVNSNRRGLIDPGVDSGGGPAVMWWEEGVIRKKTVQKQGPTLVHVGN